MKESSKITALISTTCYYLVLSILCLSVVAVSISNIFHGKESEYVPGIGCYKMLVVLSDSMKPVFAAGDVIIVDASGKSGYSENDIITFWRSRNPVMLLTHRVIGIEEIAGRKYYCTKGDANNTDDRVAVGQEEILGKYLYKVPFAGYVVNFVHTGVGFTLLVGMPILLAGGYEFRKYFLKKCS